MKRAVLAIALLATGAASAVQMASQPWVTNRITQATAATLQSAKDYTDAAISGAGGVTPEMVTNIVQDVAPTPGNYATVSNAAMNALSRAEAEAGFTEWTFSGSDIELDATYVVDYRPPASATLLKVTPDGYQPVGEIAPVEENATALHFAPFDRYATRTRLPTMADIDAATETNAAQTAALAAMPQTVTNIVREASGGIWDAELEVWWTPRMRNGSLTYEATTNVNLNAEN